MALVRYTPLTANPVNPLNHFLFQQITTSFQVRQNGMDKDEITA